MQFSYEYLGDFNGYFILSPRIFSYRCLALSMDISFFTPEYFIALFIRMPGAFNRYFIVLKIAKKIRTKKKKKIGMVYRMSVTAFRVHCIYPKKKISLHP